MMRAPWLESDDAFEGVGAHELNLRYDNVDDDGWRPELRELAASNLTPVGGGVRFDGADISHHQDDAGPITWDALRAGSWWIATKATQSTSYVDPTFYAHRWQMRDGFRHRLFYHWLSSTTDPRRQAGHYLQALGGFADGEGAMLDAEEAGTTVTGCVTWCETVEAATLRPCTVYTGAYVTGGSIWQSTRLRESKYGIRPMHLAAYTSEERARALPGVAVYPWSAWQYSSNGPVPGVVGRCDMNRVDNRAAFDVACGVQAAPVPRPPQGDDMALKLTNRLPGKYGDINESWWVLLDDGTKRHIPTLAELGARASQPTQECDDETLDGIPDYQPAAAGTVDQLARDGVVGVRDDHDEFKSRIREAAT